MAIIVPADGIAPVAAGTSAGTVMTKVDYHTYMQHQHFNV